MTVEEDIQMMARELRRLKSEVVDLKRQLGEVRGTQDVQSAAGGFDLASGTGNQRYGGNRYRLDKTGIQILADDVNKQPAAMYFLGQYLADIAFSSGVPQPVINYWSGIYGDAASSDNYITMISRNYTGALTTWFATVTAYADTSNALSQMQVQRSGGAIATVTLTGYPTATSNYGSFALSNAFFRLAGLTADPTLAGLIDGSLWYRTDTDKWRAQTNSVTENLAIESWVTSGFLAATRGNYKVFYSDGSGVFTELALGAANTVLTSNGASSAPSFAAASGNNWVDLVA